MARRILDPSLMTKLSKKLAKPERLVSVMVSQKASKLGISSEAALILLAKQQGIGTAVYQRKLDHAKQAEVRGALPDIFLPANRNQSSAGKKTIKANQPRAPSKKASLKLAVEYLIQDPDLRSRCRDLLMAKANFDRPINQATLVLEDRIRTKAQPPKRMVGGDLVGYAFHSELPQTVLRVSSSEAEDQRGFAQIMRGVVPAFRNKTHHHLTDAFTREDAMCVCGFIDVLLRVVDDCTKVR